MTPQTGREPAATAAVPLWRNRNFQLLWSGSVTALLGLFAAEIAFPLVILAQTGSPGQASLFLVVQTAAVVAFGMPAGRLLDRHDRRTILVVAETTRALAAATVVAAFLLGGVTVAHLLAVAAVLGGIQPLGAARMLLLRAAVPDHQLTAAVTAEEVRTNAADLSGPPLGGFLYGLAPALPFAFAVATFALSAVIASFVRVPARQPGVAGRSGGMFAGLSAVLQEPTMRAVTLTILMANGIGWSVQFVVIVLLQARGTPPWQIGLAVSGFAIGGLAGAALVKPLYRHLRPGVLLLTMVLFEVPVMVAMGAPYGFWWVAAVCFCFGLAVPAIKVLLDVLLIRQIPDEQRGRAIAGVLTIFTLSVPVAMAGTGLLLEQFPPGTTLIILAVALLAVVVYAGSRRALRRADWPASSTGEAVAS
jgi:MFS family permease